MKFLPLLRAHLSGAGQPVDRGRPFRLRRLDVAHEAVEMLDQRLRDLPQARIGNVLPALKHHIRAVVFGHIEHGCLLESVLPELFSRDLLPCDVGTFDHRPHLSERDLAWKIFSRRRGYWRQRVVPADGYGFRYFFSFWLFHKISPSQGLAHVIVRLTLEGFLAKLGLYFG
jgi:hypothetical protein